MIERIVLCGLIALQCFNFYSAGKVGYKWFNIIAIALNAIAIGTFIPSLNV